MEIKFSSVVVLKNAAQTCVFSFLSELLSSVAHISLSNKGSSAMTDQSSWNKICVYLLFFKGFYRIMSLFAVYVKSGSITKVNIGKNKSRNEYKVRKKSREKEKQRTDMGRQASS